MNSYKLLHAMSGIREDYVLEAMDFLGYSAEKARPHRVNRKLWTTLLVAAIIVSLFTVTAYAMGWFGLRERMIESAPETQEAVSESASPENSTAPTAEPKRWVSLNGYADSPEYRANAEWLRFREEYLASQRLHTHQVSPLTLDDFYRAAGTGAFLAEGEGSGYIYEDGSFKLEVSRPQREYTLTILKNLSGTILPLSSGMDRPENYQEWEYTNSHGDTVLMAFNDRREDIHASSADLRIFFDMDGVFVMAHAAFYESEDLTKAECEELADEIIFHELLKTEPDFSALYVDPTVADDPGSAVTLADFLASPEGQAARAWSQASNSRRGTEAGQRELWDRGEVRSSGLCTVLGGWLAGAYRLRHVPGFAFPCHQL